MSPAKTKMITILNPKYGFDHNGKTIPANRRDSINLRDYISVPWISTLGRYQVKELLTPENVIRLAVFANNLESKK